METTLLRHPRFSEKTTPRAVGGGVGSIRGVDGADWLDTKILQPLRETLNRWRRNEPIPARSGGDGGGRGGSGSECVYTFGGGHASDGGGFSDGGDCGVDDGDEVDETNWKPLEELSIVVGVVLSLWDHICGPREEQVWRKVGVPHSVLSINAPFTLQGQMGCMLDAEVLDEELRKRIDRIEPKFLVLSKYFTRSLIFSALYNGQWSTFALSFVFPKHILSKYLRIHTIITDRMKQLVEIYRRTISEENSDSALKAFEQSLIPKLIAIDNLFEACHFPPIDFHNTLFAQHNLEAHVKTFLEKVITSHLQTGCTLVVGTDEKIVSEWVNTISVFLLPHQRHMARASVPKGASNYVPDLALQGIVCKRSEIRDEEIIQSMSPTTLVILPSVESYTTTTTSPHDNSQGIEKTANSNHYVQQTYPYHEYILIRKDFFSTTKELWQTKNLFRDPVVSQVVIDIIDKVFRLSHQSPYLRQGYLNQTMSLFIRKAMAMIKYIEGVEQEISNANNNNNNNNEDLNPQFQGMENNVVGNGDEDNLEPNGQTRPPKEMMRRIKTDLGLPDDECYYVLLGIAEKLKPGIFTSVAPNPAQIEEKLIELFEKY